MRHLRPQCLSLLCSPASSFALAGLCVFALAGCVAAPRGQSAAASHRLFTAMAASPGYALASVSSASGYRLAADEAPAAASSEETKPAGATSRHDGLLAVLLYVPDRIFDLLDIFRARVRVGPGFAVGARATSAGAVYLGSYVSAWAGLPGPRQARVVPIPGGMESHNGVALSLADATTDTAMSPNYSPTECGVTLHLLLVGLDLDIDPLEVADFATGIIGIDLTKDDL